MSKIIGETIRKLRKSRGLQSGFVAKHLGIEGTLYSRIELGKREMKIEEFANFIKLLKLSPSEVYELLTGDKTNELEMLKLEYELLKKKFYEIVENQTKKDK